VPQTAIILVHKHFLHFGRVHFNKGQGEEHALSQYYIKIRSCAQLTATPWGQVVDWRHSSTHS
jgi:DNA helicase IV